MIEQQTEYHSLQWTIHVYCLHFRIMLLNLLNLYSLIIALFRNINYMVRKSHVIADVK